MLCNILETDLIKVVKEVFRDYNAALSLALEPVLGEFAHSMLMAEFISFHKNPPEYQMMMNSFLSCLEFGDTKKEVEEMCSKLLGILRSMGGPCMKAAETIKRKIIEDVKHKCNTEFLLS